MRRSLALGIALACIVLMGPRARAESPDDARARAHFEAGESYFEQQRYQEAAREFHEAFELSGRPEMVINEARALEKGGDVKGAVSALELLLERYPRTSYREAVERQLEGLRGQLPAEDGTTSTPAPPAQEQPAQSAAEPAPQQASETTPPPLFWPPRWPTLVTGSVALAAGVVALGTGLRAHALYGDLEDRCDDDVCGTRDADTRTRGQRLARTSTALSFGALALAATTSVLWLLDARKAREAASVQVSASARQVEASVAVEF